MTLDYNEFADLNQEDEYKERMGTAYNGLSKFFAELDLAFPPDERGTHSTRMEILADGMKYCYAKMIQSMHRRCTEEELIFLFERTLDFPKE